MADQQRYFFLNLTASGVTGPCQKAGHVGWLELDSWNFSLEQKVNQNVGAGGATKTNSVGRFGFSIKHIGPRIFGLGSIGSFIAQPITFEAERSGMVPVAGAGTANLVYLQIVFTKAVISSRSLGGDDGIKDEHVNLVFQTVQFKYTQITDGAIGSSFTKIFDAKSGGVTG